MMTWLHRFAMNGYGLYIWSAYGLVFFVLAVNVFMIRKQGARVRKMLRQWCTSS